MSRNLLVLFFRCLSPEAASTIGRSLCEGESNSSLTAMYNFDTKSWSTVENLAGIDALYGAQKYGTCQTIHAHAVDDVVFFDIQNDEFRGLTFAMQSFESVTGPSWCAVVLYPCPATLAGFHPIEI